MKIIYAGSPEYAVAPLRALIEAGCGVAAVLTQPDKPVGRKRVLTPTPVKSAAMGYGLPVFDFARVKEHVAELKAVGADLMITCAYGQLLTACTICTPPFCPPSAAQAPFSLRFCRAASGRASPL